MYPRVHVDDWRIVDHYNLGYWSGQDIAVFAENVWVEEALQINFMISEQVRPYYGYASHVPDRIHHGSRIISGELTCNFQRDGYLFSLLQMMRSKEEDSFIPKRPLVNKPDGTLVRPPAQFVKHNWGSNPATKIANGEMSPDQVAAFVKANKTVLDDGDIDSEIYAPDIQQNKGLFETRKAGFDLNIIYGGKLNSALVLKFLSDETQYYADGAIIDEPEGVYPATGVKLIGVSIMNMQRSNGDDGRSIVETYTFQARDIEVLMPKDITGPSVTVSKKKAIDQSEIIK